MNARSAEAQAEDALKRGDVEASKKAQQIRMATGAQRAAIAASGSDVTGEGATDILNQTQIAGQTDIATIKTNAWREAWGFRSAAVNARTEGEMNLNTAKAMERATLISGGIEAMSYGMKAGSQYKEKKAAKSTKKTGASNA